MRLRATPLYLSLPSVLDCKRHEGGPHLPWLTTASSAPGPVPGTSYTFNDLSRIKERTKECTLAGTPRPTDKGVREAGEDGWANSIAVAAGWGGGAETRLESSKRAPDRGTCTSPRGHRARPAPSRPVAHARALQPGRPASSLAQAHRAPAAPRACARWGALPSHPARPHTGASRAPDSIPDPGRARRLLPAGWRLEAGGRAEGAE